MMSTSLVDNKPCWCATGRMCVQYSVACCCLARMCVLLSVPGCRYKELAGQHKEIMQHLQHKIDAITGVTDH